MFPNFPLLPSYKFNSLEQEGFFFLVNGSAVTQLGLTGLLIMLCIRFRSSPYTPHFFVD